MIIDPATSKVHDTTYFVTGEGAEVRLTHGNAAMATG